MNIAEAIAVRFDASGVVPVVAQEVETGEVLLLAYMNEEALRRTLAEGVLVLWSRSRRALWRKGEQSGHILRVHELRVNCEENSLLARVTLEGPGACHAGYRSCFYRRLEQSPGEPLAAILVSERTFDPDEVYGTGSGEAESLEFERDARALYAAYERLRDEDFTVRSQTSRLLHANDRESTAREALGRARQELDELAGVLAGTHRHHGGDRDVILEASQVSYWATVAAVARGYAYDDWQPHLLWLGDLSPALVEKRDEILRGCVDVVARAAAHCRNAGVAPARVIAADLREMRQKYGV